MKYFLVLGASFFYLVDVYFRESKALESERDRGLGCDFVVIRRENLSMGFMVYDRN
jgi:hypothetical protein